MPERVIQEHLVTDTDPSRPLNLPIGLDPAGIEPVLYPFDSRAVHILLGKNLDVMDFLRGFSPLAAAGGVKVIALDPNSYLSDLPVENAADAEDLNSVINRLYDDYIGMRTAASESRATGTQYQLIILAGVQSVLKGLNDEEREYLREMLAQVQPAWGWAFLLCDTPQNFNDLRYAGEEQSWYNAAVSNTDGLYLGSGITSQMVLRAEGDTRILYQNIAYPLGYAVQDTVARRIQFVEEG